MLLRTHLLFAWCWILVGLFSGTLQGLRFHHDDWLGGYASWPRRLTRLGHVAFLGTALLNIAFALSATALRLDPAGLAAPSALLLAGAVTMPVVCYLSAWRKALRPLFAVPVVTLVSGVAFFVTAILSGPGLPGVAGS